MISTALKSPCGQGIVEEAYLVFILFDENSKSEDNLKIISSYKAIPVPKL
jgi:hypothetical protein